MQELQFWMGKYEERVRPFLEPMMRGVPVVLDAEQQKLLTEYLTFKMVVVDWEGEAPVVGETARRQFHLDRTIPRNTQIFLFKCGEPPWRLNLLSHAVGIKTDEEAARGHIPHNTKSFAMGLGDLFVMTLLAPNVNGYPRLSFQPGWSLQIHPPVSPQIRWPPLLTLSAAGAKHCADALWNIDEFPGFSFAD